MDRDGQMLRSSTNLCVYWRSHAISHSYPIILKSTYMSYVERLIIGLVLIISAYNLYSGAQERHNFHLAIQQLSKLAGRCLGCFGCIQDYRKILVLLVFTGGATLVMDAGVTFAIIAQVVLTALDASQLRGDVEIAQYQSLLIHLALLVFLFRNLSDFRPKQQAKSTVSAVKAEPKAGSGVDNEPKAEKGKLPAEVKAEDLIKSAKGKKKN